MEKRCHKDDGLAYEIRDVEARRREIERVFGRIFIRFTPCLCGHQSRNFKAETKDADVFFVKVVHPVIVRHLWELYAGFNLPLVPRPLCHGEDWIIFPWREGRSIHPADMTEGQLRSVIRVVQAFNMASHGRKHGDFHYRNFLFQGDEVKAIYDLECMRPGAPVDDVLRIFVHALERMRFWHRRRINLIFEKLSFCVQHAPWSEAEWLASVNRYEAHKVERRKRKKSGWMIWVEHLFRDGFYRRIRKTIRGARRRAQ